MAQSNSHSKSDSRLFGSGGYPDLGFTFHFFYYSVKEAADLIITSHSLLIISSSSFVIFYYKATHIHIFCFLTQL